MNGHEALPVPASAGKPTPEDASAANGSGAPAPPGPAGRRGFRGTAPARPDLPRPGLVLAGILAMIPLLGACGEAGAPPEADWLTDEGEVRLAEGVTPEGLEERLEQFAPVTLTFDTTLLDADRKRALRALIEASDHLDSIFRRQVWHRNPELRSRLLEATGPAAGPALEYFDIMYGPWDRLEENEPFIAVGPKPAGAGYYPEDLTPEELQSWIEAHPEDREAFTSYYTVIRRGGEDGDSLVAVPYSEAYRDELEEAAGLLREAAGAVENESLRSFLETRAAAFLSNDYFESEVAWMRLQDNLIDPTIGPYEVYEDELMGYKAAFESFLTIRDPDASRRLEMLVDHLPDLERALPIPEAHKNLDRPFTSPISVVTEVYTAGDTRAGVQTLAFNLPNDPRVREEEGSKKVMLQNVVQAKFREILLPIGRAVLDSAQATEITFEPYFTRILMHELAHGLGPDYVTGNPELTVNQALRDRYSALEEAKADVVGTHSIRVLTERGVYDRDFLRQVYLSHAADLFRCVRFGVGEAHGKGCLVQFNFLRERGALTFDENTGLFAVRTDSMPGAVEDLAREFLILQATGDYEGAGTLLGRYGEVPETLRGALARLETVPVDIRPRYAVREMMEGW